jgi:hypothetical protein
MSGKQTSERFGLLALAVLVLAAEPTPSPGETWTRPADGVVMVYVLAGASWCGALDMAGNVSESEKLLHG